MMSVKPIHSRGIQPITTSRVPGERGGWDSLWRGVYRIVQEATGLSTAEVDLSTSNAQRMLRAAVKGERLCSGGVRDRSPRFTFDPQIGIIC